MKTSISVLLACLISNACYADCAKSKIAAQRFLNHYVQFTNTAFKNKNHQTAEQWLQHNAQLTEQFKKAYQQLVEQAKREDPELGLDFDPIFNGQDYPEQGFKVIDCHNDLVTLAGKAKDWQDFKVKIQVINTQQGWLIDGAGVINMPK